MNLKVILAAAGLGLLLAGCATGNPGMVLQTVGPAPAAFMNNTANEGTLLVYSAHEVNADFNCRDPYRPEFSDYCVLAADGRLQQRVHNNSGTILQRPQRIELPPGNYRVVAQANAYGTVTVPVLIQPGRDTVVHLEGGARWSNPSAFDPDHAVCLPDGEIVGWKAVLARQ